MNHKSLYVCQTDMTAAPDPLSKLPRIMIPKNEIIFLIENQDVSQQESQNNKNIFGIFIRSHVIYKDKILWLFWENVSIAERYLIEYLK